MGVGEVPCSKPTMVKVILDLYLPSKGCFDGTENHDVVCLEEGTFQTLLHPPVSLQEDFKNTYNTSIVIRTYSDTLVESSLEGENHDKNHFLSCSMYTTTVLTQELCQENVYILLV